MRRADESQYHLSRPCAVAGCPGEVKAADYCQAHAARVRRLGDPGPATIRAYSWTKQACADPEGCDRPAVTRGLCQKHYMRQRRAERP